MTLMMPQRARTVEVRQSNLDHGHLYLNPVLDLFPEDVVGGSNKTSPAARTVLVECGGETVETDIVRDKKIFRKRGWLARFFRELRVAAGDRVLLEQVGPYAYRLSAPPWGRCGPDLFSALDEGEPEAGRRSA
jgi:hypothetical protein